jgi:hypothetical protein
LLFQKRFFAEGPQSATRIIAEPEKVVSWVPEAKAVWKPLVLAGIPFQQLGVFF